MYELKYRYPLGYYIKTPTGYRMSGFYFAKSKEDAVEWAKKFLSTWNVDHLLSSTNTKEE